MITTRHEKEILNSASLMSLLWWVDFSGVNHNSSSPPCTTGKGWRILYLIALLCFVLTWTFMRSLVEMWAIFSSAFPHAKLTGCSSISCQSYNVKLFTLFIECFCLRTQSSELQFIGSCHDCDLDLMTMLSTINQRVEVLLIWWSVLHLFAYF